MNAPASPNTVAPAAAAASPGPSATPDANAPGKVDEKSSQHGRNAKIIALTLAGLLMAGLVVDVIFNAPKKPEAPKVDDSAAKAPEADPFADFEARQRAEQARLEQERRRRAAKDGEKMPALPGAPDAPASAALSPEQELRQAARLEDLKRALAAIRSEDMIVATAKPEKTPLRQSGPAEAGAAGGNGSKAEATLAQLRQAIERARGGGSSGAAGSAGAGGGSPSGGGTQLFARDLRSADASTAVVGQAASARREQGDKAQPGEFLVPVGTVMSAVLDMEINSDWEGRWRAMLTRDIYDVSQQYILLPKGTRILGTTQKPKVVNEAINARMALAARWAVLPNGARIDLSRSGTLDQGGIGAIEGDVNRHFLPMLGGVVAYGVIGGLGAAAAAREAEQGVNGSGVSIVGATAGAEIASGMVDIGKRVASRYLNLVPTITIKPGASMTIFLDDELYLLPWAPIDETLAPLPASGRSAALFGETR
jgi:type IV secretory pathway VirB10-like protein